MKALDEIKVSERVADNLATRRAADELFDFIQARPGKAVILNFRRVEFMSRSFAHEYLLKKKETRKRIVEKNMVSSVKRMFTFVKKEKDERKSSYSSSFRSFSLSAKNL